MSPESNDSQETTPRRVRGRHDFERRTGRICTPDSVGAVTTQLRRNDSRGFRTEASEPNAPSPPRLLTRPTLAYIYRTATAGGAESPSLSDHGRWRTATVRNRGFPAHSTGSIRRYASERRRESRPRRVGDSRVEYRPFERSVRVSAGTEREIIGRSATATRRSSRPEWPNGERPRDWRRTPKRLGRGQRGRKRAGSFSPVRRADATDV